MDAEALPGGRTAADSASDAALLEGAAREAGAIALRYFQGANRSWMKAGQSPVSEADMAVDAYLRESLLAARPGYGWLSEETADTPARRSRSRLFVVDPIDGTRGFLEGQAQWCVSLAVVEDGRPVAGALFAPALDTLLLASAGGGVTLNGAPLQASPHFAPLAASPDAPLTRLTASSRLNRLLAERYAHRFTVLPFVPSLAWRLAMVVIGEADGAFARGGANDWDLAAADLILAEAGGRVTTAQGQAITYNRAGTGLPALVAGGVGRHAAMLALAREGGFLQ